MIKEIDKYDDNVRQGIQLTGNGIRDVGVKPLSEALKTNTSLTFLNLGCP